MKSDCKEYYHFLAFSLAVFYEENEKVIYHYSNLRSYAEELMDFEEDLFNLLQIKNNENLNNSIKLLDYSLGIARKNRN